MNGYDDGKVAGGHLADFHATLVARGGTHKNADLVRDRVAKLIDLCMADQISKLTPSAVQAAIGSLREEGKSLQTCNHYLRAIK